MVHPQRKNEGATGPSTSVRNFTPRSSSRCLTTTGIFGRSGKGRDSSCRECRQSTWNGWAEICRRTSSTWFRAASCARRKRSKVWLQACDFLEPARSRLPIKRRCENRPSSPVGGSPLRRASTRACSAYFYKAVCAERGRAKTARLQVSRVFRIFVALSSTHSWLRRRDTPLRRPAPKQSLQFGTWNAPFISIGVIRSRVRNRWL
jgi:hypothetical protein